MKDDTFCPENRRTTNSLSRTRERNGNSMINGLSGFLLILLLFFLPPQELQAQCESSPAICQPDMLNGHGPDPCDAKVYCSNSGAVESGLISCTNAADTDGCGIEADDPQIGLYDADAAAQYDHLFDGSGCETGNYLQWMVFATPPNVDGTKIQGVGASDSWFLFHAGSFTDTAGDMQSIAERLADPIACQADFELIACSDANQYEEWTNDNAVLGDDVYNVYYIAFFYDKPTNGSLNFKVKECEYECPAFVFNCPTDVIEESCQSQADIDLAFGDFLDDFYASGGWNSSVEWFVDGQSVGMTKPGLDLAPDECGGSVTIGYTITDDCNEPYSCEATFTVIDQMGPVAPLDGGSTVACLSEAVPPVPATVTDECGVELSPVGPVITDEPDPLTCEGTRTYQYSYSDDCGNTVYWSYVYTIEYEPFTIEDMNGSETVACEADADGVGITLPTVMDNCGNTLTAGTPVVVDAPDPLTCEGTRTYTWTFTDCEGNTADWSYVYTIEYEPFTIEDMNGSETVACEADADGVGITLPTVNDNCGNALTAGSPVVVDAPDPLTCEGTRTYTWTFTDCEGNTADWSYVYTIEYEPFTIEDMDGAETVACEADADGVGITLPTVMDNCGNALTAGTPVVVDAPDPLTCEGTRTYTWTFTDCEGNTADWSYVYTIEYEPFTIEDMDGSKTVACEADADGVGITVPTVMDNCGNTLTAGSPVVVDAPDPLTCEGTRTYTWTFTDCEGNTADWSYVYTIEYEAFTIDDMNGSETVACEADADGVGINLPTVMDNCGNTLTAGTPVVVDAPDQLTCEGTRTYTWTFTDCEGNTADWSYVYTIEYEPFTIDDMNGSETVACEADADGVGITLPTVMDNCGNALTAGTPVVVDAPDPLTCEGTRTYTWTFTDCEGNTADWSYVYTIEYEPFTIEDMDGAETVACEADADGVGITLPTVMDNCGNTLTAGTPVVVDAPDPLTCEGTRTYTWTFTDCEGNTADWSYVYTIEYEAFTIEDMDGSETVACEADADGVGITVPTVMDNCGNTLTAGSPVVVDAPDPLTCEGTRTYTWTFTDCEGNTADWSYVYTIEYEAFTIDDMDGSETVACEADADGVGITLPTVMDNCGNTLTAGTPVVVDAPDPLTCEGTRTYTWTFTDCEGNTADWSYVYTIEYEDFTMPGNESSNVECLADATEPTPPLVDDNCGNALTPTGPVEGGDFDGCKGTKTYTWTYADCEGNEHDWVYTYHIEDTTDPVIVLGEYPETVCETEVPASLTATWTDNCAAGGELTAYPVPVGGDDCSQTYEYTFTAMDDCGNTAQEVVTIIKEWELVDNCETIYGYNADASTCFSDYGFKRWGWTNSISEGESFDLTLYAGAAQCITGKGTPTGTATVTYEDGYITVEYNLMENYVLNEAHVYIGCDPVPSMKNGKGTVAPGQYNFNPDLGGGVQNYTVGPIEATGDLYVIVHGVACEIICECTVSGIIDGDEGGQSFSGAQVLCGDASADAELSATNKKETKAQVASDVKTFPVPFKETVNVEYDFEYTSDVQIEIFNMRGNHLRTYNDKNVTKGSVTSLQVDFALKANQIYILKVTTDRETFVKQIVSSKK